MSTKEITICGKQVHLAYCYATEISYKILSDEDISIFIAEVIDKIQNDQMPDIRKAMFLILAAAQAYCEYAGETCSITSNELMYEMDPTDLGLAIGTILTLRAEFYHLPKDEPKDEPSADEQEKNA